MPFEPITTQEQLDQIIQQRIERERTTIMKQYADYDALKQSNADLKEQIANAKNSRADLEKQITDLQSAVKTAEVERLKTNIAAEMNIPLALRDRLTGTTEEEIRKDAETFAGLIGGTKAEPTKPAAPAPRLNDNAGKPDPLMDMVKNFDFGGI